MQEHQSLFMPRYLKKKMETFSIADIENNDHKRMVLQAWIDRIESGRVDSTKEKSQQADFLNEIFGDVLGYEYKNSTKWNLEKEETTYVGNKFPDGVLGYFSMTDQQRNRVIKAVIELKPSKTDLDKKQNRLENYTPVEQGFSYVPKLKGQCNWVIISNLTELRLYRSNDQSRYELFTFRELIHESNWLKFQFLLSKDRFLRKDGPSKTDNLFENNLLEEIEVTENFYEKYKSIRNELFHHICENNKNVSKLTLLNKTQKILDRVLFILVCEDKGLLPDQTTQTLKENYLASFDSSGDILWTLLKGLFTSIDVGNPDKRIHGYNGGLFSQDQILDSLTVKKDVLLRLIGLGEYNFETVININILGHIFEQSISDIEQIKYKLSNETIETKKGKRKADGIYYTPDYITKQIIDDAIGGWFEERKFELGFFELEALRDDEIQTLNTYENLKYNFNLKQKKSKQAKKHGSLESDLIVLEPQADQIGLKQKEHLRFWYSYKEVVYNIKILDPACGSGAFLIQAFEFLKNEMDYINRELRRITGGQLKTEDIDRHIIKNNIYGVDLNEESVEITKLSLWLKTANIGKQLTSLDRNIQCGNSLIDDPIIAKEHTFNWTQGFPDVMNDGGFDVIIGNPPYGAKLSTEEQTWTKNRYSLGVSETAILFIKKSIELLKANGTLGFIIPKSFAFASNYQSIREYVWQGVFKLIDCGKVWDEVKLEQIIIIIDKGIEHEVYQSYLRNEQRFEDLGSISKIDANVFGFFLNGVTPDEIKIAKKIAKTNNWLKNKIQNKRGIGIQRNLKTTGEIEVLGGADIQRTGIISRKGWINRRDINDPNAFVKENSVLAQNIVAHIQNPIEHIKIIACIPQRSNYALLDTINQIVVGPDYDPDYIDCLLRSRLINWYVYRFIYGKAIRTMHFDNVVTDRIPYAPITLSIKLQIKKLNEDWYRLNRKLIDEENFFLSAVLASKELSGAQITFNGWYKHDWSEMLKFLKKHKIKLRPDEQIEWSKVFRKEQTKMKLILDSLNEIHVKVNDIIFQQFKLTNEEVDLVSMNSM